MVSTRSQRKRAASPVEAVAIVKAEEDSTALSDIASPPKKVRKTKGKGSITAAKVKKEESEDEFVPLPVDEAATPAPKGKAKAPPTPKSVKEDNDGLGPKPAKTAESTWRESDIPKKKTITKGEVTKLYRLNAKDIAKLEYESIITAAGYDCHLYKEIDVERVAWAKHGSPEGFDHYIATLELRHNKQGKTTAFAGPACRPKRKAPDPSVLPPRLMQVQKDFEEHYHQEWIFDTVMAHLDYQDRENEPGYGNGFTNKLRIDVVPLAMEALPRYPRRPGAEELNDVTHLAALKEILDDAPKRESVNAGFTSGMQHVDGDYEEATWTTEFRDAVRAELDQVKLKYGLQSEVYLVAAWLVYDCFANAIKGIHYDEDEGWLDEAHTLWLSDMPAYNENAPAGGDDSD